MRRKILQIISTIISFILLTTFSAKEGYAEIKLLEDWNVLDNSNGWWTPNGVVESNTLKIHFIPDHSVPIGDVADGIYKRVILPSQYSSSSSMKADMMIEGIPMPTTARARVAVGGTWGNAYNETKGIFEPIELKANIEKIRTLDNTYRVICNSGIGELGGSGEQITDIMWNWVLAQADTWYTATVSRVGNTLTCEIKEKSTGTVLVTESQDITTFGFGSINPSGETRELWVRDGYDYTEIIAYFDNLYVDENLIQETSSLLINFMPSIMAAIKANAVSTDVSIERSK